jgi:DNA-binding NarL/FixJ family response regulator
MAPSRNIFIVEDNEIYSTMLDYLLTRNSVFRFFCFSSGEECLKNLHLHPYMVILDYGLPGLNGYEIMLAIKKKNPQVHVVVLTTNKDYELAAKFFKAGADDYILKEGAGEAQIMEKIETHIAEDEFAKRKSFKERLLYFILILTLLTLGIIWYGT